MERTATKREFKMEQVAALWKRENKTNKKTYFSGYLSEGENKVNLTAFYNTDKKNPKEPDLRVYESGNLKKVLVSLWVNARENGKKYLTGTYEGKRVVGFINAKSEGTNRPYISIYYSQDRVQKQEPEKVVTVADNEDFLF